MKKNRLILFALLFMGCMASESTREQEKQNEERSMSTHDIPTFYSAEAEEYYNRGNDAREAGDFAEARLYFEKAHLIEPGHMLNLNNLAGSCLMLEDFGSAEKYYVKALEQDPGYEITYVNYSNFFMSTIQYEAGIKFVEENLHRLKTPEMKAYMRANLALMYSFTLQCAEAKQELEKAKKLMKGSTALGSAEEEIRNQCH